jgi:hypothetical protein
MLKIIDLNRNEELSASAMGQMAGGEGLTPMQAEFALMDAANWFLQVGFTQAAAKLASASDYVALGMDPKPT